MRISLCESCGDPYDVDEINDGFCLKCMPSAAAVLSLENIASLNLEEPELVKSMRNIAELDAE